VDELGDSHTALARGLPRSLKQVGFDLDASFLRGGHALMVPAPGLSLYASSARRDSDAVPRPAFAGTAAQDSSARCVENCLDYYPPALDQVDQLKAKAYLAPRPLVQLMFAPRMMPV
jgi:hypothetical protein